MKKLHATPIFGIFAAAVFTVGCGNVDSSQSMQKKSDSVPALEDKDSIAKYLLPVDPSSASVSLAAEPFLSTATENGTLQVPTFSITGLSTHSADYVQIARCNTCTQLKTATGVKIEDIAADSSLRLQQLKWIWINNVWGNNNNCKILGGPSSHIVRERFQDLSAKTGNFFYIINPCLRTERSTQNEVCSYNLIVTPSMAHTNTLTEEFLATAEQLAVAEARLAGVYSQLYYSAQAIRMQKETCETNYGISQASQNFWKGFVTLSIGGVSAAIGGSVSGGTAALQAFKTSMSLSVGFFKKWPPVPNICPTADKLIQSAQATSEELPSALKNVLDIRLKLSEINSAYGAIDKSILEND